MCPQARQVNLGTGVTQIFITGEEASLEDISVASTEVGLALNKAYAHKNKPMCTRISQSTLILINIYPGGERGGEKRNRTEPIC